MEYELLNLVRYSEWQYVCNATPIIRHAHMRTRTDNESCNIFLFVQKGLCYKHVRFIRETKCSCIVVKQIELLSHCEYTTR